MHFCRPVPISNDTEYPFTDQVEVAPPGTCLRPSAPLQTRSYPDDSREGVPAGNNVDITSIQTPR